MMKSSHKARVAPRLRLLSLATLLFSLSTGIFSAANAQQAPPSLDEVLDESAHPGLGNERIRRMLAYVDSLDGDAIGPALDRVPRYSGSRGHADLLQMLYRHWVELDREAALSHAVAERGDKQQYSLSPVLAAWAANEPMQAWQWFEQNGAELERETAGHAILRAIASDDPPKALEMLAASEILQNSRYGHDPGFLYGSWATKDPAAAAKHLSENSAKYQQRISSFGAIAMAWVGQDIDAAWQWAKGLSNAAERRQMMGVVISHVAGVDFERAKILVEEIPAGKARESALTSVAHRVAMEDPAAAFAYLNEAVPGGGGYSIVGTVLGQWAARDPEKAFEVALTQLNMGMRQKHALDEVIRLVSERDLERAIEMLEELGLTSNHTLAANAIARAMARVDLERARTWAEGLPDGEIKNTAMGEVMSTWIKVEPEEAARYALAQSADDPRKELLRRTVQRWSYENAQATAQWVVENLDPADQRSLLPSAVSNWAEDDADAASAWVAGLPAGEARDGCTASLGSQWGYNAPVAGEKWLESLEADPARDQAISNFASRVLDYDPEMALAWCAKIGDEKRSERALQQTASRYLDKQPDKAREWIRSSEMSEEQKKALLGE